MAKKDVHIYSLLRISEKNPLNGRWGNWMSDGSGRKVVVEVVEVSAARRNRVKWSAEEEESTDVDSVGLTFDQKFDGNSVKGNG